MPYSLPPSLISEITNTLMKEYPNTSYKRPVKSYFHECGREYTIDELKVLAYKNCTRCDQLINILKCIHCGELITVKHSLCQEKNETSDMKPEPFHPERGYIKKQPPSSQEKKQTSAIDYENQVEGVACIEIERPWRDFFKRMYKRFCKGYEPIEKND